MPERSADELLIAEVRIMMADLLQTYVMLSQYRRVLHHADPHMTRLKEYGYISVCMHAIRVRARLRIKGMSRTNFYPDEIDKIFTELVTLTQTRMGLVTTQRTTEG